MGCGTRAAGAHLQLPRHARLHRLRNRYLYLLTQTTPVCPAAPVHGRDADGLADDIWQTTVLLDALGLYSTEVYQKSREAIVARQQQELLELSTPVVQLWDGVLALPLIGTLDSARTQMVMENLLQRIVETRSAIAIIDITGVPLVDTLVAQHLLKTVAAARLMGAECLISGIRPQIAQTIVHLGVELGDVTTKATLADALAVALQRTGQPPPEKLGRRRWLRRQHGRREGLRWNAFRFCRWTTSCWSPSRWTCMTNWR